MGANAAGLDAAHETIQGKKQGFARIVLGFDGSISSRQGLTWVPHLLSAAPGSRVVIVHVHDPNAKPKSALAKQLGHDDLDEVARALAAIGVDARPLVVSGDPLRELPRAVNQLKADLLVTGSRGRGPFGRKIMGAVADGLVRQLDANMLVARTTAVPERVLLATDGSMESVHACRFGAQMARRWGVPASLLSVRPREEPFPAQLASDILPRDHGEEFECLVRADEPARGIVSAATQLKAGLVVLGRRGITRPDALVGGTAARVAKEAPASVLLLRRPPQG